MEVSDRPTVPVGTETQNGTGGNGRTRLSRAARMEQILGAAHDLFAERGYNAVTMDEVAAAVGVTKPLLYNYFGNKERLFLACLADAAERLEATVVAAVTDTSRPEDALREGLRAFFAFVDHDHKTWRVIYDEALPADTEIGRQLTASRNRIRDLVAGIVREQIPSQHRQRAQIEIEALSTAVLGAAESLAHWWLNTGAISAAEAAELLISAVEPGLRRNRTN